MGKKIELTDLQKALLTNSGEKNDFDYLKANGARALPSSPTASGWSAEAIRKQLYMQPEILFSWMKAFFDETYEVLSDVDSLLGEGVVYSALKDGNGNTIHETYQTKSDTVTALALKADLADMTAALALKANSADVNTALATKANASDMNTALASKANASDLETAVASILSKANASDMETALAGKADATATATALALKANASDVSTALAAKANASDMATALAGKQPKLTAGSGITINDNNVISAGAIGISYSVVEELPEEGEVGVIYLIAKEGTAPDVYDEFIYVNEGFEKIGNTEVDLTDYYTKTETGTAISNAIPESYLDTEVKLSSELKTYYSVGGVTASATNPVTLGNQGDTLRSVLNKIFVMEEAQPTVTANPSVSIATLTPSSGEYGTTVSSLTYSFSADTGTYPYDSSTGVSFSKYTFSADNITSVDKTSTSGSVSLDSDFTIGVSSAVTVTVVGTYGAGNVAKTNLGNNSNPEVKISAGTATGTKSYSPTAVFYCYKASTSSTSTPSSWTSTSKTCGASTTDMTITANAGDYIWIASTQSGKQIYEFNEVSNSYNTDATPTTYVGQSIITLSTGATYSYHIYRTTNPRSGATNKKFKLA